MTTRVFQTVCFSLCIILTIILTDLQSVSAASIPDISWPNCHSEARLNHNQNVGIVGINGGLDFHYNPCLLSEYSQFRQAALYLNSGYPGEQAAKKFEAPEQVCRGDVGYCTAFRYGYAAALATIRYASDNNVHSFEWWIDVETDNSWSMDTQQNIADLQGMLAALHSLTLLSSFGFYAYPGQWSEITADWQPQTAWWIATGTDSFATAAATCADTGSLYQRIWLTQYTTTLDYNYLCNSEFMAHLLPSR